MARTESQEKTRLKLEERFESDIVIEEVLSEDNAAVLHIIVDELIHIDAWQALDPARKPEVLDEGPSPTPATVMLATPVLGTFGRGAAKLLTA